MHWRRLGIRRAKISDNPFIINAILSRYVRKQNAVFC